MASVQNEVRKAVVFNDGATMQAIVQNTYGSADTLEYRQVERPEIGEGEVLVRVHAAGVDRGVWHLMTGLPYLTRIMGFGVRRPKTAVPGLNMAGVIEAVGPDVTEFRPGDEVYGVCRGAYAQYAAAPVAKLAHKPAGLSFAQAAAIPHGGLTALQGLRDDAQVQAGQRVLVIGASGAVGAFAVQLAKAYGTHVTGVASTAKLDLVTSLGADAVVDYTREDLGESTAAYDVILDTGGRRKVSRLRKHLTPGGTLVIVGGEGGGKWTGGFGRAVRGSLRSPFMHQNVRMCIAKETAADLRVLNEFVADGKLTPAVEKTYPLQQAADAIRELEAGRARGRIMLIV